MCQAKNDYNRCVGTLKTASIEYFPSWKSLRFNILKIRNCEFVLNKNYSKKFLLFQEFLEQLHFTFYMQHFLFSFESTEMDIESVIFYFVSLNEAWVQFGFLSLCLYILYQNQWLRKKQIKAQRKDFEDHVKANIQD